MTPYGDTHTLEQEANDTLERIEQKILALTMDRDALRRDNLALRQQLWDLTNIEWPFERELRRFARSLGASWRLFRCRITGGCQRAPNWYGCERCGVSEVDRYNIPAWMPEACRQTAYPFDGKLYSASDCDVIRTVRTGGALRPRQQMRLAHIEVPEGY